MAEKTNVPEIRFAGFTDPWEQRKLGDVATRHDNLRIPITAKDRIPGDTPYYGANGIQDYVEGYTHEGEFVLVAEDGATDLGNYPVQLISGLSWVNNHAHVIKAIPDLAQNRFIMHLIKSMDIASYLVGGTRSKLNAEVLMGIELKLPSNSEQIYIGTLLSTLDSLITLHQRKYDKLCAVKKSMLDKMFPKPGEIEPEIRFAGFTDPWEQRKLGEIAPVTMGQSPNGACYTDNPNDVVLVQGNADLKDGWVSPRVWTTEITKTAKSGDLIMSVRAPVGAMGKTAYDVVLGRGVAGIVGNEFLFQALSKKEAEGYWSTVSAGSTFDSINGDELRSTPIDCPRSETECEAIGNCLSKVDYLITLHQRELNLLKNTKKSLLDKMFV